ncbi:hypothetical protein [Nocardioides nitrophenolicus]|uniref:hypothetical protein n=1 Tax=Nocardioides nitrophenolicus TaxID=60489 RepID=UPI000AAB0215|nr:hypothetical protein [Nocardioides nitrophenolicus]MBM7518260.1 hypothetical protein [Nocardioides nitrophenolicus]
MRFVVESVVAGHPAWWLIDNDGLVLAWSGTTYASLAIADHAAHRFRVDPEGREYRTEVRGDDSWRWTAWNPAGERVAVSGDYFTTSVEASDAADRMSALAGDSIGP